MNTAAIEVIAPEAPRVLVIDDSKLARYTIRSVLASEFTVLEAEDGEDGWRVLTQDERIQVVITDAAMPNLDGYGLIRRIRSSTVSWVKNIPIIMVTGVEEGTARVRALEVGVSDFFTKPVYKTQLLTKVRSQARMDQTTRKLIETSAALAEQGAIDPVTGINSRRYFVERMAQDLAYSKRHAQSLSIIFLDADNYDAVHRSHGEDAAHRLLTWIAQQLKDTVRTEDIITRLQDSRFAVTMTNSGRLEAAVLGNRLRKLMTAADFTYKEYSIPVTASLSLVCVGRDPVQNVEEILALADQRIAHARSLGGNRMISSDTPEAVVEQSVTELLSNIDAVLQHAAPHDDQLKPYLASLAQRALQILDVANSGSDLEIADGIRYIKAKLDKAKPE